MAKVELVTWVANQFEEDILSGKFLPGDPLPPEREISAKLKVSRSVVREAIGRLTSLGLVHSVHGSGNRVQAPSNQPILMGYRRLLSRGTVRLEDVSTVRLPLETAIAALAAKNRLPEHLDRMADTQKVLGDAKATLDEHILAEALKLGCDLHRPATVRNIVLNDNDAPHSVEITLESGEVKRATCRWLLDASGKATLLGKQLGTVKPLGEEHPTSSVWTRYRKVNDVDSAAVRAGHDEWTSRVWAARSVATNHLMGRGWWCWLIPLSDGTLSAGIVWDRTLYDLPPGENMASRLHAHLLSHPVGKLMFEHAEQVEDDLYYYKNLSYYNESMCGNRWALLGDAAGFIDPLYSQGLDFCGHTVYAVTSMLKKDFRGECIAAEKAYMGEGAYGRSYRYWFEALYKGKYHYMGDAELMWAAFLMDLATYFIGRYFHVQRRCPYFFILIFANRISYRACFSTHQRFRLTGGQVFQRDRRPDGKL